MVGDALALLGSELGGADVHPPVQLQRIGVDDLPAQLRGEGEGQVGLAGRGGAHDGHERGAFHAGTLPAAACPRPGPRCCGAVSGKCAEGQRDHPPHLHRRHEEGVG